MKNKIFNLFVILILCVCFSLVSCGQKQSSQESSSGADSSFDTGTLILSEKELEIHIGESVLVTAAFEDGRADTLEWSTNRTKIATVENGMITGVSVGTAVIKAQSHGGATALCSVTVTDDKAQNVLSVAPSTESVALYVGDVYGVFATVKYGERVLDLEQTWSSEDVSVASVDKNGRITALGNGETVVASTVVYKDITAEARISVTVYPQGIYISPDFALNPIIQGDKVALSVSVYDGAAPLDVKDYAATYTSSDTAIATVEGSTLTAKKYGDTVITVECKVKGENYSFNHKLHVYGAFAVDYYSDGVLDHSSVVRYGDTENIVFNKLSSSRKFKFYTVNGIKTDKTEFVMPDERVRVEAVYVNDTIDNFTSSFEKGTIFYNQGAASFVNGLSQDKNGARAYGNGAVKITSENFGSVQFNFEEPIIIATDSAIIMRLYRPTATELIYMGNDTVSPPVWIGNKISLIDDKALYRYETEADAWTVIAVPLVRFGAVGTALKHVSIACSNSFYLDGITIK